jgi:hypothetical protein
MSQQPQQLPTPLRQPTKRLPQLLVTFRVEDRRLVNRLDNHILKRNLPPPLQQDPQTLPPSRSSQPTRETIRFPQLGQVLSQRRPRVL